ncbi:MAG: hypothetical protein AAFV53_21030 [Myxococcota bacterium]
MSTTQIRALLVGGKRDYQATYDKIKEKALSTFGIDIVKWVDSGGRSSDASLDDIDVVLISSDICGHNLSDTFNRRARADSVRVVNIHRKWATTKLRLMGAGFVPVVLPEQPDPQQPAPQTTEAAPSSPALSDPSTLPEQIAATLHHLVTLCDTHQIDQLIFDLKTGEVDWERHITGTLSLRGAQ